MAASPRADSTQECTSGALGTNAVTRVDIDTVTDITRVAAARNDTAFLLQIENLIPTLDIVSRDR